MKNVNSRDVPNGTLFVFDLSIFYIAIKITNDCWIYILKDKLRFAKELYDNIDDRFVFVIDENEDAVTGEFVRKAVTKVG